MSDWKTLLFGSHIIFDYLFHCIESELWRNGKVVPLVTCMSRVRGVETASLQKCKEKVAYMCAHPPPTPAIAREHFVHRDPSIHHR
ncbi:hypothetical protein O6P43_032253 [Quillaja saponaria]|uniref:Uncharacterized protein n=1 Tax=Quillaja saponaria TaxID=32244 RepID=A0AAD7KN19_QUISA|nr:hypothetical protein O6P43_032253 [Quillaja saponaria]